MRVIPRRRWQLFAVVSVLSFTLVGCGVDVEDCGGPQDARQRFVRAGDACDPTASPRRLGFAWNGYACGPILSGDCRLAGCEGSDCGALFGSLGGCRRAYAACDGTCAARLSEVRDEVPTHPICRAAPDPAPERSWATFESCHHDDDCRDGVNGRCVLSLEDQVSRLSCAYDECFVDADCPAGRVCAPLYEADPAVFSQSNLFCVRATCASSADCANAQACTLRLASSGGVFSPRPSDYHYACGDEICGAADPTTVYRVTDLRIPTLEDVDSGAALGHNVDNVGEVCGVVDYAGGVDNQLLALNAGLLGLGAPAPLDLQAALDEALACETPSALCTPLALSFVVQTCDMTTTFRVRDGQGRTLAGPVLVIPDGSGWFRASLPVLPFAIPIRTSSGVTPLGLPLENVIVHGRLTRTGLEDVVIGGMLSSEPTLDAFSVLLAGADGGPSLADVEALLVALIDVRVAGECQALSVGLRATTVLQE